MWQQLETKTEALWHKKGEGRSLLLFLLLWWQSILKKILVTKISSPSFTLFYNFPFLISRATWTYKWSSNYALSKKQKTNNSSNNNNYFYTSPLSLLFLKNIIIIATILSLEPELFFGTKHCIFCYQKGRAL